MIDWSMEPIFGYTTAGLLGLALLLGLIFLREERPLSRGRRAGLWMVRLLIVLVVMLGILRPGLTFTSTSAPKGAIGVLMDLSTSMELSGIPGGKTRWQEENELWKKLQEAQERIGKDNPLVLYGYDNQLRSLQGAEGAIPAKPVGTTTDIGKTLSQLLSAQTDPPLSAVFWMGDGTQTVVPSTVDAQMVARQLGQMDIPLMVMGLGPRGDSDRLKDISVEAVPEQVTIFTSNPTDIIGIVRARGMLNREIPVQLWMRQRGGEPKMIAQDTLRPEQIDQSIPFRLPLVAPEVGNYELEVRVPVVEGELLKENNQSLCYLNVHKGGRRILFLFGEPVFEPKFIRSAVGEYKELQLDSIWIQRKSAKPWPIDLTAQLSNGEFDAYVLGDVDSKALTPESIELLCKRVEEGAGLVTLGGYQTYGPGGYAQTKLAEILPIEMDGRFRQQIGTPIQPNLHYQGEVPLRPKANSASEVTKLVEGDDNMQQWMSLRPMQGAVRWTGVKKLPGVQVLLESSKGEPMMVRGEAGQGKVISIAFDTTYQWRMQGKGDLHRQFWRQVILSVMRNASVEEGLEVNMQKRRLYRSESVEVSMKWNSGASVSSIPESTQATLYEGEKSIGPIVLQRRDDKTMVGKLVVPDRPGRFEVRATAQGSAGPVEAVMPLIVMDQSIESLHPIPDWALMEQMAKANESAGGVLLSPAKIEDAIQRLIDRRKTATIEVVDSHRLGDTSLDTWIYFAILIGLMSFQWSLRKRWSLV